ncbi:hypothetical protein DSCO28_04300 [Desulfosarcina ovata subsp. sediminis]|uniref:Damage-control phosphatase ARMT1-like metal-binding domain-containing protein n=1 Tax=Desulfosarcina ovata subsp. sediminis TaxID=885957 RepID=A0A5K7ZF12_9BACT|nr:ARMT1-like domain-containing protein [Desulfosarcina ovata]BBO79864.1 hypothetical protein DSCO28_04300 [Desulfosarcina ovata subsp. sediminis]
MESTLDCIVCFVRQALDAARMVSADSSVHEEIVREVLQWTAAMDLRMPPPVLGQRIHRRLRKISGNRDPYRAIKAQSNRMALELMPDLKKAVEAAPASLIMALRLALAGNVIDMGVSSTISSADIQGAVDTALTEPLVGPLATFRLALHEAHNILYLADNAGEIVFDRLLIEQLGPERVTVAVRGAPVINDATLEDATEAGLDDFVSVVDNGSDAPGTLLEDCSETFRRRFDSADLIIAKGQGNFESLSSAKRNIFFLFKVKCSVIASHVGLPQGTHVLAMPKIQAPVHENS